MCGGRVGVVVCLDQEHVSAAFIPCSGHATCCNHFAKWFIIQLMPYADEAERLKS